MACFNICRRSSFNPCDCECRRVCLAGATGPTGVTGATGATGPTGPIGPTGPTGVVETASFGYGYSNIGQTVNATTTPVKFTVSTDSVGVAIDTTGNVSVENDGVYEVTFGVGPSTAQADVGIWSQGSLVANSRIPADTQGISSTSLLMKLSAGDSFYISIAQTGDTLTLTGTDVTAYVMVKKLA